MKVYSIIGLLDGDNIITEARIVDNGFFTSLEKAKKELDNIYNDLLDYLKKYTGSPATEKSKNDTYFYLSNGFENYKYRIAELDLIQ